MQQEISVPVKLLEDFTGKRVTVDASNGEIFVGTLSHVEDNMSVQLNDVSATFASGHKVDMKNVYLKGHKIRYVGLPEEAKSTVAQLSRSLKPQRGGFRGRSSFRGRR